MPELVLPNPQWSKHFSSLKTKLTAPLPPVFLAVEHIGSTAIPELKAKNIVDVQCAIEDFSQMPQVDALLSQLGFQCLTHVQQDHIPFAPANAFHPDWEKRFYQGVIGVQPFNLHIRRLRGKNWRFALSFRDYLRDDAQARMCYQQFKERLATAKVSFKDYCLINWTLDKS